MKTLQDYIDKLNALNFKDMYNSDFFLTWEKTDDVRCLSMHTISPRTAVR